MQQYSQISNKLSKILMRGYSTSFGWSALLLDKSIRQDIYNIYGLVRIADEIVDTYKGKGQDTMLKRLQAESLEAIKFGYSANPIVHSMAQTFRRYDIDTSYLDAFFESMAMDLRPVKYDQKLLDKYIYGSAEVVGLMCLSVYFNGDKAKIHKLSSGARSLGAAYQKVNFLRDMADDSTRLHRMYFPGLDYDSITEQDKNNIIKDIEKDFNLADKAIALLPPSAYRATLLSRLYYGELLNKLSQQSIQDIKTTRVRVNNFTKFWLMIKTLPRRNYD